jgi:hypothetical protein
MLDAINQINATNLVLQDKQIETQNKILEKQLQTQNQNSRHWVMTWLRPSTI